MAEKMKVYQVIGKIQSALAKTGILKDRKNAQQGYNFRGIDDVYNALAPLLAEHGLVILPRVLSRTATEKMSKAGAALNFVVVEVEFDFIAAEDGSKHTVKMFGEAMDSADKATNKALSAAYKYACLEAFAIPTEGDNDADATTHEIAPAKAAPAAAPAPAAAKAAPAAAPKASTSTPIEGCETVRFVPKKVTEKKGHSARGEWTKYGVLSPEGAWYGTFETVQGELAKRAADEGVEVVIDYSTDGKFFNIVRIILATDANEIDAASTPGPEIEEVPF